jgi:nucleoside-diphosphate-sugar epimerase
MKKIRKSTLITGGCGFVGRNLIRKLVDEEDVWIIDDLSIGLHPDIWLNKSYKKNFQKKNFIEYSNDKRKLHFITTDIIDVLTDEIKKTRILPKFSVIFHFASIVGGRELIEGDPILVGKDMAIDSIFFYWLTRKNKDVEKVLYASSSAAYPVVFQGKNNFKTLKEGYINFETFVGIPDMTYGWSKLTGEYLSRLSAQKYLIPIACVRPFSGYGEDQDFSYPIPAIAKRVAEREDPLMVWGTGKQGRDFVHINDCIDAFYVIMKKIKDGSACNIGSGKLTSFLDVLRMFSEIEGYNPKIVTLPNKPVGVLSRFADTSLLNSFGWSPKISNEEGFKKVLNYIKKYRLKEDL